MPADADDADAREAADNPVDGCVPAGNLRVVKPLVGAVVIARTPPRAPHPHRSLFADEDLRLHHHAANTKTPIHNHDITSLSIFRSFHYSACRRDDGTMISGAVIFWAVSLWNEIRESEIALAPAWMSSHPWFDRSALFSLSVFCICLCCLCCDRRFQPISHLMQRLTD